MRKTFYWAVALFLFCGWADLVWGQMYFVGDTVNNFSAPICTNGEGDWSYEEDGFNKVLWVSSFATW
jgi:hypothetical protein